MPTNKKSETLSYETTFILAETATDADLAKKSEALTEFVTKKLKGSVSRTELWGRRELAYVIKKSRTGLYATMWLDITPADVTTLEKELRFDESIIRSLVTKAYTVAQPGSLYPVVEEPETDRKRGGSRRGRTEGEETGSAEEELRRSSTESTTKITRKSAADKAAALTEDESVSEEDRLKKLDEALGDILKDEA